MFNAQAPSASISNEDENPSFIQAFMSKVQTNKIQLECFSFLLRIKLNFPCVGRDVSVLKCAKTMCHRILICTQALRCEAGRWGTSDESGRICTLCPKQVQESVYHTLILLRYQAHLI